TPRTRLFPYTTLFRSVDRGSNEKAKKRSKQRMITVRYFARLKEIAGKEEEQLSLSHSTVQELITWAIQTYDGFASEMKSSLVARSEEHTSELQSRFDL